MGHERIGLLPKTEKWRKIVSDIASTAEGKCEAEDVVRRTAEAVDSQLKRLHLDPGIQDAFFFLVALSVASRSKNPQSHLADNGIDLAGKPATPIALVRALSTFMRTEQGSLEYHELAREAAAKALSDFYRKETVQPDLFGLKNDPFHIWKEASDGSGFSVLARQFFSHLTSGYIKYFLDREASAVLPSISIRNSFQLGIDSHIDRIVRHSFETSKITQSFAAGWYNKNAKEALPSRRKAAGFLSISLNKIRDSLNREKPE